jgi:predicted RNA binding protein YcfA (HicA-like mRNA interferase family)
MPKKIRELKSLLIKSGFEEIPGKGSHTKWIHDLFSGRLTLSGKDGSDAKPYQEKEVTQAIQQVKEREKEDESN